LAKLIGAMFTIRSMEKASSDTAKRQIVTSSLITVSLPRSSHCIDIRNIYTYNI